MHTPSNLILTFVGFFMAYGAVGTMEVEPQANLVQLFALACAGLCLMFVGVNGLTHTE